jgi:hypothetical protein
MCPVLLSPCLFRETEGAELGDEAVRIAELERVFEDILALPHPEAAMPTP